MEVVSFDSFKLKDQTLTIFTAGGGFRSRGKSGLGIALGGESRFIGLGRESVEFLFQLFFPKLQPALVSDPEIVDFFFLCFERLNLRLDNVQLSIIELRGVSIRLRNSGRVWDTGFQR